MKISGTTKLIIAGIAVLARGSAVDEIAAAGPTAARARAVRAGGSAPARAARVPVTAAGCGGDTGGGQRDNAKRKDALHPPDATARVER